jgi:peptidoglycan lytic transglycosylase
VLLMFLALMVATALALPGLFFKPTTPPIEFGEIANAIFNDGNKEEETYNFDILEYISSFETGLTDDEEKELASVIYFESMKYGYDPKFILAIIQIESTFNPKAVSVVGARGLMQIMPATGKEIATEVALDWNGIETLYDPEINISMGMYYLFKMLLKYRDLRLALVAYNAGPGYVDGMLKRGRSLPETYVDKVMGTYEKIKLQEM